jgi:5-methylcytosine-specific restriction endonuclease McrA
MMLLHERAVELSKIYRSAECELLDILIQMADQNLFIEMKYLGMFDYLVKALSLSETQSGYFERVVQRARAIPELREAVVSGKLKLSQARRICGVIDSENCIEWIHAGCTLTQRELEKLVAEKRPRSKIHEGIKPVALNLKEMKVALSEEDEGLINRVQDLVSQRLKKAATLQEAVRAMATCYLEKFDPVKKALRASSRTGHKTTESSPGSHRISNALKHAVHLRDGFRCTGKDREGNRCKSTRWLHLHHIIEICHGGTNSLDNLTTLCSRHHAIVHLSVPLTIDASSFS